MHVKKFSVRNIQGCSEIDLEMDGPGMFLVGGANANGKTSSLTALAMALCGKKKLGDKWPDMALKEGEKEGFTTIELTGDPELQDTHGFLVEHTLRRKRGGVVVDEIRVLDSTGEEASMPRDLLNKLYNFVGFDPLEFRAAKPKDRAEMLRELLGLDFTELDEERKKVFMERTVVNSEGKAKKARLDAIEYPEGTSDEPVSAKDLFDELEAAQKSNESIRRSAEAAVLKYKNALKKEADLGLEAGKLRDRLAEIDKIQVEMDCEMPSLERDANALASETLCDEAEIRERLNSVEADNRHVAAKKQADILSLEVNGLREESSKKTARLKQIDKEKQTRLETAKWPVEGLALDESGVLFNELPFEQASTAEQTTISSRIGMAMNPKLRLLICKHGNDMDNETLAALEEDIKANDFQMLLEFVTRNTDDERRCAVVFENGVAKHPVS